MKRIFLPLALFIVFTVSNLTAQVRSYPSASISNANSVAYALPRTAVKVTIVMEKESIRHGPYARFVQKYLGVMAPLTDKDIYTITDAHIGYGVEADPQHMYVLDDPDKSPSSIYYATPEGFLALPLDGTGPDALSYTASYSHLKDGQVQVVSNAISDTSFLKVSIDRRDVIERTPEEMASSAANMIYMLRKRRVELVTGEMGDYVFSGGLQAGLDEINRLEHEYLALFLGKQIRQTVVREFTVIPEAGKNNLVVCRFSDTTGAVSVSDLSASPIVLEMKPEGKAQNSPLVNRNVKDSRGTVHYRIADMVDCTLSDGSRPITQARIPIYQFGATVQIPVTALK